MLVQSWLTNDIHWVLVAQFIHHKMQKGAILQQSDQLWDAITMAYCANGCRV